MLGLVRTYNSDRTGDSVTDEAELGLALLAMLAEHGSLTLATIDRVSDVVRSDARGLAGIPQFVEWLATVAPWMPFPDDTRDYLLNALGTDRDGDGYARIMAFKIMGRNSVHLDQGDREVVVRWAEKNARDVGNQDAYVDGFGYLAAVLSEKVVQDYLATQMARIGPLGRSAAPIESWGGEIVIAETDVFEWRAIARIARTLPVARDVVEQLLSLAAVTTPEGGRTAALGALAYRREEIREKDWGAFARALARLADDGDRRAALADAAGLRICELSESEREVESGVIRGMWFEETVPVLRLAFARTLRYAGFCTMTK